MTLDQALLHALSKGESVTVYDETGRQLNGPLDPTAVSVRDFLRALVRDNPRYTFGTTSMAPGEALEAASAPPGAKA